MIKTHIIKRLLTVAFTILSFCAVSQTKNIEVIKITSANFSKITSIKELVKSIPKNYEIESVEYVFNDGEPEGMQMNGNEIPISITGTDLINKQGTVINLYIKYFKDKKVVAKHCKVIIE